MRSTAGRVLEEVVSDIYLMGAKPVGEYEAERVDATIKDLQIDRWVRSKCLLGFQGEWGNGFEGGLVG
jgi:hypothetical protein